MASTKKRGRHAQKHEPHNRGSTEYFNLVLFVFVCIFMSSHLVLGQTPIL